MVPLLAADRLFFVSGHRFEVEPEIWQLHQTSLIRNSVFLVWQGERHAYNQQFVPEKKFSLFNNFCFFLPSFGEKPSSLSKKTYHFDVGNLEFPLSLEEKSGSKNGRMGMLPTKLSAGLINDYLN